MGWTDLSGLNQQFLISIIIISIGYIFKRTGLLKESDGSVISRVIFNLTLPALIIVSFHDLVLEPSLMILVFFALGFGFFLAIVGIILFKNNSKSVKGMLIMIMPGMNIALFAYPLVEGIWGTEGIKYFGMLDAGNAFIVFGLTYILGSFYMDQEDRVSVGAVFKEITNSIPLMMYLLVFVLNILNFNFPTFVIETASVISFANMPLSLLLLGLYLSFSFDRRYLKLLVKYLATRYGVSLVAGVLIYFFLPAPDMIRTTLLIGLSLPIPLTQIPYAEEFNYDKRFIGMVSNITMIVSFFMIWLMVNLLF